MASILDEVRQENSARLAYLQAAKDALLHAKFEDVTSDGQDIFNIYKQEIER